jgi:GNAT superfamily N-acetyltransferase
MDASFLTRVLSRLEANGLVESTPSPTDGRALDLALTDAGRAAYAELDARSAAQIAALVSGLSDEQRRTVAEAMTVITSSIRPGAADRAVVLRGLRAGDMGWVVERHGAIYADEYGWDADFEALVARIVADYHAGLRPDRESAWIAEVDGARAGCVFCCRRDASTAQLRILLVEPWARGLGIGSRLVEACTSFAAEAGYDTIVLWTNDVLVSARRIYEAAGFRLVDEERHHSFGHDLVGQHWELALH